MKNTQRQIERNRKRINGELAASAPRIIDIWAAEPVSPVVATFRADQAAHEKRDGQTGARSVVRETDRRVRQIAAGRIQVTGAA